MKRLSRNDIETISEKFVKAYFELPEIKKSQVYRIEPELMLEKVLGLTIEYMHLSYDGSILGMTSFGELGVQVFENNDDEAFFFLDGKTVLVESDLNYDNNLKGRKNFTLMIICIGILLFADALKYRKIKVLDIIEKQDFWFRWMLYIFAILGILTFGIWGSNYDVAGFIYFQF